jgi:hypothetical protein
MFLEHHLGVVSLRLKAEQVAGSLRLVRFLAEPECRHEYRVELCGKRVRRLIKPDAFALFEDRLGPLPTFIEFDRGTASLSQMTKMFARYRSYWAETAFQSAYCIETPFTVAVITTAGQRRIDHLAKLSQTTRTPVIFTTFEQVSARGFAAPIWQSTDGQQSADLRLATPWRGDP